MDVLKTHIEWRNRTFPLYLNDKDIETLHSGALYLFGRDFYFRPIVVLNFKKIMAFNVDNVINVLTCLLTVSKANMFVPGKIENWIVIMDLDGCSVFKISVDVFQKIIDLLTTNYVNTLEKLFILNPPFGIQSVYKIIERKIKPETASKIRFVDKKNLAFLKEFIPNDQMEQKYGGNIIDLLSFWPPSKQSYTKSKKSSINFSEYYSCSDQLEYENQFMPFPSSLPNKSLSNFSAQRFYSYEDSDLDQYKSSLIPNNDSKYSKKPINKKRKSIQSCLSCTLL